MAGLLVVALLAAYAYYRSLESGLKRESVSNELGDQRPPETGALNVLLVGSDSREGDNKKYGAKSQGLGERSDTIMLLHMSPDRDKVTLVSFPRDLMVAIPPCKSTSGVPLAPGVRQINSAFNDGGIVCAMRTVESLTKLRLDHFVKVDFTGFKGIIDALDGISICLPKAVNDPKAKLVLAAGKHVVSGEQALGYVRARYSMGDGSDLSRIKRQQIFLTQVMKKVTDGGMLTDPGKLNKFLKAAVAAVTVDDQLSLNRILEIARSVQGMTAAQLKGITVPVEAYPADHNRVQLTQPAADDFFTRLRSDVEVTRIAAPGPSASASATPQAQIPNGKVRIQVLNGSGKPRLAKQAADELAAQGFVVDETGNAPTTAVTEVRYAKRLQEGAAYADAVAARLSKDKRTPIAGKVKPTSTEPFKVATPSASPTAKASGPIVQLVIGADWPGVRVASVIPDSLKDKTVDASTDPCQ
ncbi:LCP family protein [Nonomuraea montanisoli]|uniref:LCP family protein n=1 Tax=Nonomuraea montanisoli TaxID=2741721 RepID=UPI001F2F386E|nr:LCP family protein [Nonomuraea montanisoli]